MRTNDKIRVDNHILLLNPWPKCYSLRKCTVYIGKPKHAFAGVTSVRDYVVGKRKSPLPPRCP